jgi:hypothetical protein
MLKYYCILSQFTFYFSRAENWKKIDTHLEQHEAEEDEEGLDEMEVQDEPYRFVFASLLPLIVALLSSCLEKTEENQKSARRSWSDKEKRVVRQSQSSGMRCMWQRILQLYRTPSPHQGKISMPIYLLM